MTHSGRFITIDVTDTAICWIESPFPCWLITYVVGTDVSRTSTLHQLLVWDHMSALHYKRASSNLTNFPIHIRLLTLKKQLPEAKSFVDSIELKC